MPQLFALFLLCPLAVIFGLFLLAYACVHAVFTACGKADRRQQAEYEVEEWERHIGLERATLLRSANPRVTTAKELLRSHGLSSGRDSDSLLRATEGSSSPE